jgi:dihydroneopterin aldolase
MLILVSVNDVRLRIPVGFYPEEVSIKTDVLVSVSIKYESKIINDDLSNTINYQLIGRVLKEVAEMPCKLLETYAERVIDRLSQEINHIHLSVTSIRIKKMHILESNLNAGSHEIFVEKNHM